MSTSSLVAPDRSLEQRRDALHLANTIRSRRSVLKVQVRYGIVAPSGLLLDPPAYCDTMKVIDLLLAQPKVGRVKANKMLNRCRISPSKTVGGLSPRQRAELARMLGGHR